MKKLLFLLIALPFNIYTMQHDALAHAVRWGHRDKVEELLAEKDDANNNQASIKNTGTYLHLAVGGGHANIAQLLIKQGANVHKVDNLGLTPLHWAAMNDNGYGRNENTAQVLLDQGAKIDIRDNKGDTPLHLAARIGMRGIVLYLIANGADINSANDEGDTPLHCGAVIGAVSGRKEAAQLLIYAGANPFIKNTKEQTALDHIQSSRYLNPNCKNAIIQMLDGYMPIFKSATDNPPTKIALEKAVKGHFIVLIKQLLQKIRETPEHITHLGEIAQQEYLRIKEPQLLAIGRLLRDYARNLRILPGLTYKSDKKKLYELPSDCAREMAVYITK